ncbi:MAG: hypothetical protein B7X37_06565 [Halothiobacillus sp. 14-55-98]|nr:MAG: hypothetical protein B7X37_06565 [Halothiobacillus sp. 14-55-98]
MSNETYQVDRRGAGLRQLLVNEHANSSASPGRASAMDGGRVREQDAQQSDSTVGFSKCPDVMAGRNRSVAQKGRGIYFKHFFIRISGISLQA